MGITVDRIGQLMDVSNTCSSGPSTSDVVSDRDGDVTPSTAGAEVKGEMDGDEAAKSSTQPPSGDKATSPSSPPPGALAEGQASPRRRGHPRYLWAAALLAVASLTLLIYSLTGFIASQHDAAERAGAVQAAGGAARSLTSFNFGSADADIQRLDAHTTAHFQTQFSQDKDAFAKLLREGKVQTVGSVKAAGLADFGGDTAQVLVAIEATVQNAELTTVERRYYRMQMSMLRQNGVWLADSVTFVP
jgi:Mce-associated membrane protein